MSEKPNQKENLFVSFILNLVLPVVILKNGGKWFSLDEAHVLILALLFPALYFCSDLMIRRCANFISVLGFMSILMTGGIGLFELSREWLIIKEGTVPLVIGLVILLSLRTRYPLVKTFLYNENIFRTNLINERLDLRNNRRSFNELLTSCTWLVSASFFISSILQFFLASIIVTVGPDEDKALFNEQVGDLTWVSYIVILVPSMLLLGVALWHLIKGIEKLAGLGFEEMLHNPSNEKASSRS